MRFKVMSNINRLGNVVESNYNIYFSNVENVGKRNT